MAQKLIQPINQVRVTASMNMDTYTNRFGFPHYGTDMVSTVGKTYLYGLGEGKVVACGWDDACGNVMAVVYYDVINNKTGSVQDLTVRYFHMASFNAKVGQEVHMNTKLGNYGFTGKYRGTAPHLHVEADLDTKNVLYTPSVKASNFLRGTSQGAYKFTSPLNTVVNVLDYIYTKPTPVESQTYTTNADAYVRVSDRTLPIW